MWEDPVTDEIARELANRWNFSAASLTKKRYSSVPSSGLFSLSSSGIYKRYIEESDRSVSVISKACPLFVPLVEEGLKKRYSSVPSSGLFSLSSPFSSNNRFNARAVSYAGFTRQTFWIKFGEHALELTRSGAVNVHMIFEENRKNMTSYNTPYGNILIGIDTRKIHITQESDRIVVTDRFHADHR